MTSLTATDLALLSRELPPLQTAHVRSPLYADESPRLDYRTTGPEDAPALVFLHGLGSSSAGYRAQSAGLSQTHRVIAWDAPGFGQSTPLADPDPDVWQYTEALGAFLDALGIRRVAGLVGSSWGSIMATAFAARHSGRVGGLVLSGANTARGDLSGDARNTEMAARLETADTSIPVPRSAVADRLLTPQTPVEVRRHVERLRDAMTTVGWRQAVKMLFSVYTPDLIGEVKCPVALLAGSLDRIAPHQDHALKLRAAAPSAALHLFEGFGHMLKLEAPTRFNDIVRATAERPGARVQPA
jgi:pimeloyl-ACP methyl ester carboxylesterase